MNLLYSVYLTVNPAPIEGDLKPGLEEGDITPGLLGFLATLFLALCVVFLIRDMVKRIRRVRYRSQAAEAQLAAADGATAVPAVAANEAEPAAAPVDAGETAGKRPGTDG
ncbi:hypothetical protein H9639_15345 [Arthrobacter sp. Sa2CUA1]|uniref:DUF1049 domain-containing protein n=1 Tax=Arthrobacter gallicola TaxID=2762225 RepID=A0ABR8UVT7_9MICC|nr:hypothetical protein [Arthrobacter gallicola]MBD7996672.1 hypothetical protein [Arthrobacter gallicola]